MKLSELLDKLLDEAKAAKEKKDVCPSCGGKMKKGVCPKCDMEDDYEEKE
jgi:rubrerythrin